MYAPQATRTITRRNIKATESRIRGLSALGDWTDILNNSTQQQPSTDLGFKALIDWITGRSGEYKLQATSFAENAVKTMYGKEPDCSMPPPGIPIIPKNPTPQFCGGSIAGMIERCRLSDASSVLNGIKQQFMTRMNSSDPVAPYIRNWWNQYGQNDFSNLTLKIQSSQSTCGGISQVPPICGAGRHWEMSRMQCVSDSEGGGINPSESGMFNSTTIMIMAIAGIAMMMLSKR